MIFRFRAERGFRDDQLHFDPVVAKKFNGYIVNHNGEEVFIQFEDIRIISISDAEKALPVRF